MFKTNLSKYQLSDTRRIEDDGYIGVPVVISVFSKDASRVTAGIGGTPLILYVVNTNTKRVGTTTDTEIITSMLERGYLVAVVDYLCNKETTAIPLSWSVQRLRKRIEAGEFFNDMGIPTSDYRETYTVPAGCDILLDRVYWEIDKHSCAGTLEYIKDVWNKDFRSVFAERVIKWVDASGKRKATQNGYDGTCPVWLNQDKTENTEGEYIKVKHTKALDIEDCVKPDGSPLDLKLYMRIIYPTNPQKKVPVMCLAVSGDHSASVAGKVDRPQFCGFVFSGYVGVIYDYGYTPMARSDHYREFSGSDDNAVTGDNVTYSLSFYNDKKINTAAMRFIRYLALSDKTYAFDTEAIGVFGNSKGGWMTYLGEKNPEILPDKRYYVGHHGESRYEADETECSPSGVIKGGEIAPWLTYNGEKIDSGANLIYASCGGAEEHITKGHAPTFVSTHLGDPTYYAMQNHFINNCRCHNVPCLWFEMDLGHLFAHGKDINHGVDTLEALYKFCDYYLKGKPDEVVYTVPANATENVRISSAILVKFTGPVAKSEIEKATLTDELGNEVVGEWTSLYGETEWTLTPSAPLKNSTEYTVRIPATLAGNNGREIGNEYTYHFKTADETKVALEAIEGEGGAYRLTMPIANADKYTLRFSVTNDAHNLATIFAVEDSTATPIATVGIGGKGLYECDVTEYVRGRSALAFLVRGAKAEGVKSIYTAPIDAKDMITLGKISAEYTAEIPNTIGACALKVTNFEHTSISGSKESVVYYSNNTNVLKCTKIIKDGALDISDTGRRFTISLRIYDTTSRRIQVYLNSNTSYKFKTADYKASRYNLTTKPGEWLEFSFDYTVYEPECGEVGRTWKSLYIDAETFGDMSDKFPLYIDSIKSYETVSDINVGGAELICSNLD